MKLILFICSLLLATCVTAKEKKISLEDIERDNLSTEKKITNKPSINQQQISTPAQFGFVPVKTIGNYERQQPQQIYVQPQYVPGQQYVSGQQHYVAPQQQYSTTKYIAPQQQYATSRYVAPQQYQSSVQQQPQQYYYQPQNNYQQYENVQYVTDNSINQPQQQYYTPQYVYLQQYPASSNEVQSVVDPKGAVQYVMYIPNYVSKTQEQNQDYVDNVVYTTNPSTQYVAQQPQYVQVPTKTTKLSNREPKSLLESYVPSILQVQYYKQQQQVQANSLQDSLKLSAPISGKVDYVKSSYRPSIIQSANGAESTVHYKYQLPSAYQQ